MFANWAAIQLTLNKFVLMLHPKPNTPSLSDVLFEFIHSIKALNINFLQLKKSFV